MDSNEQKKAAAMRALGFVEHGMRLGLGTGSTAAHFVDALGDKVADGLDVLCVPTSEATRQHAERRGIALTTLDETPALDLTVDGADEIGPRLALIKGGGGALLREKIVAAASKRMVVIADASKKVDMLGAFPLPVEVVPFGARATALAIEQAAASLGLKGKLFPRTDREGETFVTDNGNFIHDCHFGRIGEPEALAGALAAIAGVVEHGLFVGIASVAVVAGPDGVAVIETASG